MNDFQCSGGFNPADYTGKPYSFRSYNCWHHAVSVRSDAGIATPEFMAETLDSSYELITEQMLDSSHGLVSHDSPQNFDIVICHKMKKGKALYHCGVWYNGFISHCSLAAKQVVFEPFRDFKADYKGVTFWR